MRTTRERTWLKLATNISARFKPVVSFTDDERHAGHFLPADEAYVIAQVNGYTEEHLHATPVEMGITADISRTSIGSPDTRAKICPVIAENSWRLSKRFVCEP
jgi:hypothetical protein